MGKLKDLAVVVGTYKKNGEDTFKWKTVGALIEGANGKQYIMLDKSFNPAGCYVERGKESSDQIVMSLFEPKSYDDVPKPAATKRREPTDYSDDDIGF